jgi:hypothetical protein
MTTFETNKTYKMIDTRAKVGKQTDTGIELCKFIKKYKYYHLFESESGYKFCILNWDIGRGIDFVEKKESVK